MRGTSVKKLRALSRRLGLSFDDLKKVWKKRCRPITNIIVERRNKKIMKRVDKQIKELTPKVLEDAKKVMKEVAKVVPEIKRVPWKKPLHDGAKILLEEAKEEEKDGWDE